MISNSGTQFVSFSGCIGRSSILVSGKKVNESLIIKNIKVDYFLKRLEALGRSIGASRIIEIIKKNDLVRRLGRKHNRIDLRQVITLMRDDTKVRLQNMLADDMRELTHQLGREDLPGQAGKQYIINKD